MFRFSGVLPLIVACCTVWLAGACRSNQDSGREQLLSFKCAGLYEKGGCWAYGVSVTDLVVRPDAYQNLHVQVIGYFSNEFEDEYLYPSDATYEHYEHQNAIRVSFPSAERSKYDQFLGKNVQVEGTFRDFAVRDITRVDLLGRPNRNQPVPPPPPVRPEEVPKIPGK
jgi:hypothetical protein